MTTLGFFRREIANKNAIDELKHQFRVLEDPRVEGHTDHDLLDILVLSLCGVMAGAQGWDDIEDWARGQEDWLRQ